MPDPADPAGDAAAVTAMLPVADAVDEHGQTLKDVELFRPGIWNGNKYTVKDIDDMILAAQKAGYVPPVTLGHGAPQDAPAYGWVKNMRREGDILLADFEDVPDELMKLIKERRYDAKSIEVWCDLKRDGETFRRALKSVAILGAHPPGVSNLKPLSASIAAFGEASEAQSIVQPTHQQERQVMPDPKDETGGRAPTDDDKTKKFATDDLVAQFTEMQTQLRKLQEERDEAKRLLESSSDANVQIRKLTESLRTLEEERAKERERDRQVRIKGLVEGCNIPRYRKFFAALADVISEGGERTAKFSAADGEEARPTLALTVLGDFIDALNDGHKHLFERQATGGRSYTERGDFGVADPGSEFLEKVDAYERQHKVSFNEAMAAVKADPKNAAIVRAYSQVQGH